MFMFVFVFGYNRHCIVYSDWSADIVLSVLIGQLRSADRLCLDANIIWL
jgi:hypothetical protein